MKLKNARKFLVALHVSEGVPVTELLFSTPSPAREDRASIGVMNACQKLRARRYPSGSRVPMKLFTAKIIESSI
jgi:hypothetical protein